MIEESLLKSTIETMNPAIRSRISHSQFMPAVTMRLAPNQKVGPERPRHTSWVAIPSAPTNARVTPIQPHGVPLARTVSTEFNQPSGMTRASNQPCRVSSGRTWVKIANTERTPTKEPRKNRGLRHEAKRQFFPA